MLREGAHRRKRKIDTGMIEDRDQELPTDGQVTARRVEFLLSTSDPSQETP